MYPAFMSIAPKPKGRVPAWPGLDCHWSAFSFPLPLCPAKKCPDGLGGLGEVLKAPKEVGKWTPENILPVAGDLFGSLAHLGKTAIRGNLRNADTKHRLDTLYPNEVIPMKFRPGQQ